MRKREQSGVRQILKICKECARVCAVNTRSQNSVTNNSVQKLKNYTFFSKSHKLSQWGYSHIKAKGDVRKSLNKGPIFYQKKNP